MDKKSNVIQFKNENFYFLYLEKESEKGITNRTWHMHSFYEIMFFIDSESEYAVENNRYVTKRGDVLLIKPGSHHFERRVIKKESMFYCLGFSLNAVKSKELARRIFDKSEHIQLGEGHPIEKLLSAAKDIIKNAPAASELLLKSIAESVIIALDGPDINEKRNSEKMNDNIEKILDFINLNLLNINSIDDIASAVFFSNSYIRGTFKREMGIGVMQYIRNKKILLAHARIADGERPTKVFAECGFANYPSFYRAYVSYFGHSPRPIKKT